MNRRSVVVSGLLVAIACTAGAEPADIYESVDDIAIGRVFLTQAERRKLDERRTGPDHATTAKRNPAVTTRDEAARAAGYIINSRGSRKAWSGDDFVDASQVDTGTMRFPGDVPVVRHAPVPQSDDDGEGDDGD